MNERYDFDIPDRRRSSGTRKWDELESLFGRDDLAPFWIADMDFKTSDAVTRALSGAVNIGVFGYPHLLKRCREATADWLCRRHGYTVDPRTICFMPRVIGGIALAIHCLTQPGEEIVVQTPVYRPLQSVVEENGRTLRRNPLKFENGRYLMDLDHLESLFAGGARVFLFCSPHNPVGRVWSREELRDLAQLCIRYDVRVFSDEIHQDLIYSDRPHTMLATVSREMAGRVVTFTAPTKTFNLAGLMVSVAVLPAGPLLEKYERTLQRFDIQVNQLGQLALCAAYRDSDAWLRELLNYLEENRAVAELLLRQKSSAVSMVHPEGTYLYWLDLRNFGCSADEIMARLTREAGIAVYDGRIFGPEGAGFIRFNAACPRKFLIEGLERICRSFQ